jgi:ADP-ribose pyrophosphatase YjhB (NUDIX family)
VPDDSPKPSVGVATVVWRDSSRNELLLGLGHSAENRDAIYAVTGGHWESGETLVDAVRRETLEEAGVTIKELRLISVYEFFNAEKRKSYVSLGFESILDGGEPTVMEPDKKSSWGWYSPDAALKLPLFDPDKALIERAVSGVIYEVPN